MTVLGLFYCHRITFLGINYHDEKMYQLVCFNSCDMHKELFKKKQSEKTYDWRVLDTILAENKIGYHRNGADFCGWQTIKPPYIVEEPNRTIEFSSLYNHCT